MPDGLLLQHIVSLKQGQDVLDESGNVIYRNSDFTLPPRKSRTYAYCSDTEFDKNFIEQINKVDLLYHEATFVESDEPKARETKHSTAKQAATVAQLAEAGGLLLGHFSARYRDLVPILEEARTIFPDSRLALEGEEFTIPD